MTFSMPYEPMAVKKIFRSSSRFATNRLDSGTTGSHRILRREGWVDYVFPFHDGEEIGPRMMARIAKKTGLTPGDL